MKETIIENFLEDDGCATFHYKNRICHLEYLGSPATDRYAIFIVNDHEPAANEKSMILVDWSYGASDDMKVGRPVPYYILDEIDQYLKDHPVENIFIS